MWTSSFSKSFRSASAVAAISSGATISASLGNFNRKGCLAPSLRSASALFLSSTMIGR